MDRKSDYDKVYLSFIVIGALILLVHLYYYCHPLFRAAGLTSDLIDSSMIRLRHGGMFDCRAKTKGWGLFFILTSLVVRGGKGTEAGWTPVISVGMTGVILYVIPFERPGVYLFATIAGGAAICWAVAMTVRKMHPFRGVDMDPRDTFEQCEELMETPDSINIRTRYHYKGRERNGWINVVSPFRATAVFGVPGSGKSYSVYGPFIEQMIAKGYSMFVYDYKYPDLSEIVYNELLLHQDAYPVKPEFHVINFKDPRFSNRCNPINPDYITDPADTTEIAELVMLNVNKAAIEKEDFFTQSAKVYLDALIYFLKIYEGGKYCTFPHAIELMGQDYKVIFDILSNYPELEVKIKPFKNALEGGAQDQLQGQIASAQIPLNKFVSPALYWVLTGNDFTLDINNPEHPKILCVGNDPDRQTIYGTTLALFTAMMFKLINRKGRLKCGVLLDELPTIYLKGIDNLIATARSNGVGIVVGAQDKSQLRRDYGDKESDVIFNTVGNIFSGQVNGKTAEDFSRSFGKEFRRQESQTHSIESESVNVSFHQEEILPVSMIETLSQGMFFGKVADNNNMKIDRKFFCGEIQIDAQKQAEKRKKWKKIPEMTSFGEASLRDQVYSHPDETIRKHFEEMLRKSSIVLKPEEFAAEVVGLASELTAEGRAALLEEEYQARVRKAVNDRIMANFRQVKNDVQSIVRTELARLDSGENSERQKIKKHSVDPLEGL